MLESLAVVTSFSAEGYAKYGQRCIETLDVYWPREVALHIVSEDRLPLISIVEAPSGPQRKVYMHDLLGNPHAKDFLIKHEHNPVAHGRGSVQLQRSRHGRTGYSFRHDAFKFSKKVFAIEMVADELQHGRLIWIDADTVTFAHVPLELLGRLPPSEYPLACLDRGGYHSECGFVGYNLSHPETLLFIRSFAKLYYNEEVFRLAEWHDSWVFDWLRKSLALNTFKIPYSSISHPFNYSELGRYMDHLKGGRKARGASSEHPLRQRRA